ncbi:MAG: hypothetical protein WC683_01410 [bacterium]
MTKYRMRGGGEVVLTQANFLGAGGEGQVYAHGDEAFKVYLKPERMVPEAKIDELSAIADDSVIRPQRVLLDGRGRPVGYSMRRVPDAFPLCQLFTRAFQARHGLDGSTVLRLVQRMRASMEAVHAARVLVVDANEMNFLATATFEEVCFIDVDSYQTPRFPATALMESVRDWHAQGCWTTGSDWFSWGIVTFQLFVGIHPYKGRHPTVRGLPDRMRANLSVFNAAVSVPPLVPPLDVIPSAYRDWYRAVFEAGRRDPPPASAQASAPMRGLRPASSAGHVDLRVLHVVDGDVLEYVAIPGGAEAALVRGPAGCAVTLWDGTRPPRQVPVDGAGSLAWAPDGTPLYAWIDRQRLRMRALDGGAEVPLVVQAAALTTAEGRLYAHDGEHVVEVQLARLGGQLVAAPRVVANVAPLATQLYPGVALQSVLGAWYANVFPAPGRSDQVRLADLDGARVVDAWAGGRALLVLAERGGSVDRYVYAVGSAGAQLRWADRNVGHGALNVARLARGVVALIDEGGELSLFPERGAQVGRRIADPAVAGLRLVAAGDTVVGLRSGEILRVTTRS